MRLGLLAAALGLLLGGSASAATRAPILIALSPTTGKVEPFPQVVGNEVRAIVGDGNGGWFVAGNFTSVGGVKCKNLVHIRSDATVDPKFCPQPSSEVDGMVRSGNVLYVAGFAIQKVAGVKAQNIAALDTSTGKALRWRTGTSGEVYDLHLSPDGSTLYASGFFSELAGVKRSNFGAVDVRTQKVTSFRPDPNADQQDDSVLGFLPSPDGVYAFGLFDRIGGLQNLTGGTLVRLDSRTGKALPFPSPPKCLLTLELAGSRLYVGRSSACGAGLTVYDTSTQRQIPWKPQVPKGWVEALALGPHILAGAASADGFDYNKPRTLFAVDPTTGRKLWVSPTKAAHTIWAVDVSGRFVLFGV